MRRLFIVSLLLLSSVFAAQAQKGTHQLRAGAGVVSSNELGMFIGDVFSAIFTGGKYDYYDSKNGVANYSLDYKYYLSRNFALGPSVVYYYRDRDVYRTNDSASGNKVCVGFENNRFITTAVEGTLDYYKAGVVKLYGTLGAGATYCSSRQGGRADSDEIYRESTDNSWLFNFQISPIGIEVGHRLGGYIELGAGYKGIVCAGAYFRF